MGSCRKKEDPKVIVDPNGKDTLGKVSFTFENMAGSMPLDTAKWYLTENGDSLKVNEYKYYVTNFVLHSGSNEFKEWESYYLVDHNKPASKTFIIDSIPHGTYDKISFLIGVDEKRNTSGAQTGALDIENNMFWDWNSGYMMAKLDGVSPQALVSSQMVSYHIVGFKMGESTIRKVTLNFPAPLEIKGTVIKNIHLKSDLLEWFKNPNVVKIAETAIIGNAGEAAMSMADNYADMFTIDHID
ncbi:MAG TPA: hypothetical protein PL009_05875 [Flavipsychrobacter sp.]|nr:hypothetical protein [Flavipsychrobacter sp.]